MLFALLCIDKPGSAEIRTRTRPDHVAYLNSLGDKMKLAGPFLDDAGDPTGSLVVVEAENRAAAEIMAADDPYKKAGLFSSVEIRAWRWTLKNPEAQ